ncbi:MAG: asparagine--tRNA ligase [Candidatus Shikimatogenerans sp. JK-2022]|nr:asparagine--tRNA ligase [Candidatus Shikimatogenerans bostrichidophilus]
MGKKYSVKYIIKKKKKIINKKLLVIGWVKYIRNNFFFILNDGSTIKNLQIIIKNSHKKINIGDIIKVYGKIVFQKINKKNIELLSYKFKIISKVNKLFFNNSILQNKYHSLSKLREQVYLRFRTNIIASIIKIRHILSWYIHKFFKKNNFFYIHTPIITNNNSEGGGESFKVYSNKDKKKDLFKGKAKLTVSGQLEAESIMLGLGKVYTFGPVFRAENSNTNKHLSEFWMVEPEIMFYKLKNLIKLSIKLIKYLINKILKKCIYELKYLERYNKKFFKKKNIIKNLKNVIKNKFIIISYTKIIKLLKKKNKKIIKWGDDIKSKHEKIIFNKIYINNIPIIIYNYPTKIKPFYMKLNKNGKITKSMDILFPNIGEIVGGSEREISYNKLIKRIKKDKINIKNIIWYVNLRKLGKIYHSGFGLGFDRFLQFITGIKNIRDVIPFPIYSGIY